MTGNLDARLAAAVTDEEAASVLLEAVRAAWPITMQASDREPYWRALRLLDGPSAGWLGVGVLMVPANGASPVPFTVQRSRSFWCCATVWTNAEFNLYITAEAKRPDCALVLAALKSTKESQS